MRRSLLSVSKVFFHLYNRCVIIERNVRFVFESHCIPSTQWMQIDYVRISKAFEAR